MEKDTNTPGLPVSHRIWVKLSHWVITICFLLLVFTGIEILMVHPRLYWGEVGNELTPALLEFPISRNYQHGQWEESVPFYEAESSPVSAGRTHRNMFNQNGWGRSLHFLVAWITVITGTIYFLLGFVSGYFRKFIWPKLRELSPRLFIEDIRNHLKMNIPRPTGGPQYGLLQKFSYMVIIFLVIPLAIITGFTMSPAITASYPFLLDLFSGFQSARTIHFLTSIILEIFVLVHLFMIIKSGFQKHILFMTIGKRNVDNE